MSIESDTAVFVLGRAGSYLRGERTLVEVAGEAGPVGEDGGCRPTDRLLAKMASAPHVALAAPFGAWLVSIGRIGAGYLWSAPPAPPAVAITTPTPVIFTDESTTVTWSVTDADCVSNGSNVRITRLLPDPANPSGSKYDGGGWGAGWSVGCGGQNPGSLTIQGAGGPRHTVVHVHASNAAGKSGAGSQWVDTLGTPIFEGAATSARQAWIRATLKKIDTKLREGRVLADGYLDSTVKAFQKGCLSRTGVWGRLLAELQNLNITAIRCEDTQVAKPVYASFEPYAGRLILRWKATTGPSEYAVCHELVHKAGFHDSLLPCGLTVDDVECGADHVASAILGLQPDPC